MAETMEGLEDEIKDFILSDGRDEMISGQFKISIKEGRNLVITEIPQINLRQLTLPLVLQPEESKKGGLS